MSSESLRVSVVIPTHGRRDLLLRLLGSLEKQTLGPSAYEVIIVHNHTPDGTEEAAKEWCARQPFRARYFRFGHRGPTRSRDFGARTAEGRYVVFIDDDCIATPGWLEAGIAAFLDVSASWMGGDGLIGLVQGRTLPNPDQPLRYPCKTITVDKPSVFFETCNIFYLKEAFEGVGGFSEEFLDQFGGEDTDLGWKVTQGGYRACFAPDALVYHEVFAMSFYKWVTEPFFFESLPYLAKKYPALRRQMYGRYFFSKETFLFNTLLVAIACATISPIAGALLAAPYVVGRYRSGSHVGSVGMRAARMIAGVPRGLYTWWALVRGSIRARTVLL